MNLAVIACPQLSWDSVSVRKSAALTAVFEILFEIFVVLDSGSYKRRDKNSRLLEDGSFKSAGRADCFKSRQPPGSFRIFL